MNEGQDSLSPDTFQQDLDSATSGILRIVPCEPQPFIGVNVKEPALVMVEVTIASSYSKIYRCSPSKPDVQLARFGKASKDLARTGGDRDLFDDRPATGDRFDRQGVPLFLTVTQERIRF